MAFDLESRGTNTHLWVTGSRGALIVLPADVELGEEPQELHVARGLRRGGGRELTFPFMFISYFRGKRLIWLYQELIKSPHHSAWS